MRPRRWLPRIASAATAAGVLLGAAACGSQSGSPAAATSALADAAAHGKDVFYLGPTAGAYPLWEVPPPDPAGPDLAPFEVYYGPCVMSDGTCTSPVVVSTRTVSVQPRGGEGRCGRLESVLGVPTAVLDGDVSLFTGRQQVSVLDYADDRDQERELALLATVRRFGSTQPADLTPPPSDVVAWLDTACGAKPGDVVEPTEQPYTPSTPADASDPNRLVPDFTVTLVDGGQFTWSTRKPQPLALVVGNPEVVERELPRLVQAATSAGRGTDSKEPVGVMGLAWDMSADKFAPPPTTMAQSLTSLGAPVGYTSVPLSAVWFFDAASNVAEVETALDDGGLIALVSTEGVVMRFAPLSTSQTDLRSALHTLR